MRLKSSELLELSRLLVEAVSILGLFVNSHSPQKGLERKSVSIHSIHQNIPVLFYTTSSGKSLHRGKKTGISLSPPSSHCSLCCVLQLDKRNACLLKEMRKSRSNPINSSLPKDIGTQSVGGKIESVTEL